jgi:hypothetical protein
MESAMTLDLCIGLAGQSPSQLLEAARLYTTRWKPEADAASWISEKSLFENRYHTLRALTTMRLGLNIASQAKSAVVPYSGGEAQGRAAVAALGELTGSPDPGCP